MQQIEPPPYKSSESDDETSDIVHPVILELAGRLIHSESAHSPALYELDRDVSLQPRVGCKVVFSRHERRARTGQDGGVRTSSHQRHIFNLECPHAVVSTSRYAFFLTSVSRKTLGSVGLKKTSVPRLGFKVMRINRSGEDEELFEITRKDGRYEWWDNEARRIAIEDNSNAQLKMVITTALSRQQADVRASRVISCCSITIFRNYILWVPVTT
ncbi:hypothetical protein F4803DRAFT_104818 [Xylaria telfairii]|nr:hypothetical protein F4803DRAFT_104818 [Xylaria telfairii]